MLNAIQPRGPGRPKRHTADALTDRVLDAATQCFAQAGYSATMQDIATTAGVGKKAIYALYSAKSALFVAVLERLRSRRSTGGQGLTSATPILAALRSTANQMIMASMHPDALALHKLLLRDGAKFPELTPILMNAVYDEFGVPLAAYLKVQLDEGKLRSVDPQRVAEIFTSLIAAEVNRMVAFQTPVPDPLTMDAFVSASIDIFVHGLAPVVLMRQATGSGIASSLSREEATA